MSGSSHGLEKHTFIGSRIGTGGKQGKEIRMLYTPAHIKPDGKPVSSRLVIPILINQYGKQDPNSHRLIAWGPLADMFAKNLSQGKEMTFICDGSSYWGNVFYSDGTQVMQKDGRTPLQTRQTSFVIREFAWGGDSNRTIQEETTAGMQSGEGLRPVQWQIPGSPDNGIWKALMDQRKQTFYQGGERFGYAHVVAPRTAGCQILLGDQSKILRTNAPPANAAVNAALPPGPGANAPLVHQVHNALQYPVQPGQPGAYVPPVQNQPIQPGTSLPAYTAPA